MISKSLIFLILMSLALVAVFASKDSFGNMEENFLKIESENLMHILILKYGSDADDEYNRLFDTPPNYVGDVWLKQSTIDPHLIIKKNDYFIIPLYYMEEWQGLVFCHATYAIGCLDKYNGGIAMFVQPSRMKETPSYGGCNVLYHEILHGMGYSHGMMKELYPNDKCKNHR